MDVTSPGGVSGEQAGAGGRDVGQEEPALHLRGQCRAPSALLCHWLALKWAALTVIGFDPSGPTPSDLGGSTAPRRWGWTGGTALSPCEGGRIRASGVGCSG